jgi:hypothetical protein
MVILFMPSATAIVLADAAGTPVNHTFNPVGLNSSGVFEFTDTSQANAVGYWKVTIDVKQPSSPKAGESSTSRTYRIRIGLHEPVLETVSNSTVSGIAPAPTVAYIPRSFIEFILPERSTLLDRQNMRKMSYNLLNNSQVISVVESLERIW